MKLLKEIDQRIAKLPLESPLFYNASYGLRFNLGGTEIRPANFLQAMNRCLSLFDTFVTPEDEVHLMVKRYHHLSPNNTLKKQESKFLKRLSSQIHKHFEKPVESYICPEGEAGCIGLYLFNYQSELRNSLVEFFWLVVGSDDRTWMGPHDRGIWFDLYVYNKTKDIIFHPYDSRGADLVAANKDAIAPIYHSLQHWLLTQDLEKMDKTFGPTI